MEYLLCPGHWEGPWDMKTNTRIIMQCTRYYDRVLCQLYSGSTWVDLPQEKESFLENIRYKIPKTLLRIKHMPTNVLSTQGTQS